MLEATIFKNFAYTLHASALAASKLEILPRDESLAGSGRAIHQTALRWLNADPLEKLWVGDWQLDGLADSTRDITSLRIRS